MATTYEAIASVTVGSGGTAALEFTNIPGTYTDLVFKYSGRTVKSATGEEIQISFNGNTSNYSEIVLYNSSGTVGSSNGGGVTRTFFVVNANTSTANTFGSGEIYIPNYASSNNKSVSAETLTETNGTGVLMYVNALRWADSAAITSIKLQSPNNNNFMQYSTATLYGIKNS